MHGLSVGLPPRTAGFRDDLLVPLGLIEVDGLKFAADLADLACCVSVAFVLVGFTHDLVNANFDYSVQCVTNVSPFTTTVKQFPLHQIKLQKILENRDANLFPLIFIGISKRNTEIL